MAFGQKKSGALRALRSVFASRSRGDEARDRMRVRWLAVSVGVGTQFDVDVTGSNSEIDSGIDLPQKSLVLPWVSIEVLTAEATGGTKTLTVGLLSSETAGDADGFMVGVSVATAGMIQPSIADGAITYGALLYTESGTGADVAYAPTPHAVTGANAVSISMTAGSNDFAELSAVVYIPYMEPQGEVVKDTNTVSS